jgi:hypothetical protein
MTKIEEGKTYRFRIGNKFICSLDDSCGLQDVFLNVVKSKNDVIIPLVNVKCDFIVGKVASITGDGTSIHINLYEGYSKEYD